MTKKDFELIAGVIRKQRKGKSGEVNREFGSLAVYMADALGEENPRFDRPRFLAACRDES